MKTDRAFTLLGVLLLVAGAGAAAWLDSWFMGWAGNRAKDFNPLTVAIGEGQKLFAGHFYRKADAYFHSGMYPSIFDNDRSFKQAHIGEAAGATASPNSGDEENFLGRPRDLIDRFSRNFFPSHHTHLDQGCACCPGGHHQGGNELADGESGEVREILPWLKIAAELDPEAPQTYTVAAYWLRDRMGKVREAELFLCEGLKQLPNHPALLFELGRTYFQDRRDVERARNIWERGSSVSPGRKESATEEEKFILQQIEAHLAKLEESKDNPAAAVRHWEQVKILTREPEPVEERIAELRQQMDVGKILMQPPINLEHPALRRFANQNLIHPPEGAKWRWDGNDRKVQPVIQFQN